MCVVFVDSLFVLGSCFFAHAVAVDFARLGLAGEVDAVVVQSVHEEERCGTVD